MGKHRKLSVTIISILVLICIGVIMYILIKVQSDNDWDEIYFTYGLNAEDVNLSQKEQQDVDELIWSYKFTELTQTEYEQQETLYGGSIISVKFVKGDTSHQWIFSDNGISYTRYEQETEAEVHHYAADRQIQKELEAHINILYQSP